MKKFNIGDSVSWSSQSNGSTTTKEGIVIATVPAKVHVKTIVRALNPGHYAHARTHKEAMDFASYSRDHESYVIEVKSKSGKGKNTLYFPRVSALNKV